MSPHTSVPLPSRAIVVGSSGGIGAALERELTIKGFAVTGLSRPSAAPLTADGLPIDLTSEPSIEAAAFRLRDKVPFSTILVTTGLLHDADVVPEKALRELDQASLMRLFAVNAVGPAPARQQDVAAAIGAALGRRSWLRVPAWLVRVVLRGQASLPLGSRRIAPARALARGYRFEWTNLGDAMADVLRRRS